MRSQKFHDYGAALIPVDGPTPKPTGSEVLIRTAFCGVCHSDVHIHDGSFHLGRGKELDIRGARKLPFTLGHEIVGTVAAIGPDAKGIAVGDKRVVYPWIGCGTCALCRRHDEGLCPRARHFGITVDGGFADHVLVPDPHYLLAYEGIPDERAGLFACSGLSAYSALKKLGSMGRDDAVLIIGAGGVGMTAIAFAKALFGRGPLVADIDPKKREAALAAGAEKAYDPSDPAIAKMLVADTGGGAAGAIDFVGADSSTGFALAALRRGGHLVIVGLFGGLFEMPTVMFPMRGLTVQGSMVGTLAELRETLDLAASGRVDPVPITIRGQDQAGVSLDDLRQGRILGRIVLSFA